MINPFETRRGVEFMDRVPRSLQDIAEELEKLCELEKERNELIRNLTETLLNLPNTIAK